MIYLTKYLAQAGVASRRQAEQLIRTGKVTVDGELAALGAMVTGSEDVRVRGKVVSNAAAATRLVIAFN